VPLTDYIDGKVVPEMNKLAEMGTEIMWCDIGGPNKTAEFAAKWYNAAAEQNRQVSMNARCGLPGDFDTPEYARYPSVQRRKWESNLGMDPYSYGWNAATPLASYMSATEVVTSLIDIVSKNGNFLLDVGPMANGTILDLQQRTLREAGIWIKSHAEAIFDTTYWFIAPQEGEYIHFTKTSDAFYIHFLKKPSKEVTLTSPIPWVPGDKVTVVGGKAAGTVVPSSKDRNGRVQLTISDEVASADQYAWVFKIPY